MKVPILRLARTALLAGATMTAAAASPTSRPASSDIATTRSMTIQAAPDIVWSTVRDFDALRVWAPARARMKRQQALARILHECAR